MARTANTRASSCTEKNPGRSYVPFIGPDTQYLFDEDRYDPQVLAKTLQWIVDHTREKNIVFTVQLGDIVNNGLTTEFAMPSDVFKILDNNDIQYGYSAGNHDINGGLYDNVRCRTTARQSGTG